MSETDKQARHSLAAANYKTRKKEYLKNLEIAVRCIDADGETDDEVIPKIESNHTSTDYRYGGSGWNPWKRQSDEEPSHSYGGYIPQ